jgi:hypothetical protein
MLYYLLGVGAVAFVVGVYTYKADNKCHHRFEKIIDEENVGCAFGTYRRVVVYMCKDCGKKKIVKV